MQENNIIYEISKQIKNKDNIKKDLNNAFLHISNMFKDKYINKIDAEVKNILKDIQNNPSKEINLLNAIKPFLKEDSHVNIDNTINFLQKVYLINNISQNINQNTVQKEDNKQEDLVCISAVEKAEDSSIKEDGVYDIDENCIFGLNNIMQNNTFLLLILFIILINR